MSVKQSSRAGNFSGSVLDRYQRELFEYLMRRLRNAEDARDVAQEIYLRLLRVSNFPEIVEPLAYIYRTASNAVSEFHMRRCRDRAYLQFDSEAVRERSEHPEHFNSDDLPDQIGDAQALGRALEKLSGVYRDILLLRLCEGADYPDIARRMNLSAETVKTYYLRAITTLKRIHQE